MDNGFKIKMEPIAEILSRRGLDEKGRVQKYVDSEALRLSSPYMPFQSGMLDRSGVLGTELGSGEVRYNAPYSRYEYYGKVMVGRAPKRLTSKDITYHGAPMRGAYPFERMKVDHLDGILNGAAKMAGGEAK